LIKPTILQDECLFEKTAERSTKDSVT